jgi:hypothetical protein
LPGGSRGLGDVYKRQVVKILTVSKIKSYGKREKFK